MKYTPQEDLDEEKKKFDDLSQFKVVRNNLSSDIDNLCENIKTNANLSGFTHVDFDKQGSVDKKKVDEAKYDMKTTFKTTLVEISKSLPKILNERVKQN